MCDCDKLEGQAAILKDVLDVRDEMEKNPNLQTSVRVSMLMRMMGNEMKTSDSKKKAELKKELTQAAAACVRYLEQL